MLIPRSTIGTAKGAADWFSGNVYIDAVAAQYLSSVRAMHELHVAPTRRHAHLIIPEGGENSQALDVIVGRLLRMVGG